MAKVEQREAEAGADTTAPVAPSAVRRRGSLPPNLREAINTRVDRIRAAPRVYWGLTAAFVFLRVVAIIGTTAEGGFNDSSTFRQGIGQPAYPFVSLTGHAMRPWVAPLLYAILPSDNIRTDAQFALSIFAWLVLAVTVARALRDRRVRVFAFAVILALSCTIAVSSWDRMIGAESTAISFLVLALATSIRFVRRPSVWNSIAFVVSLTLWSFTKSGMFPVVGLTAVIVGLSMIKGRERALRLGVAALLILVSLWGFVANSNSDKAYSAFNGQGLSQFGGNFATLLRLEILNDKSETAWFVAHGMPNPVGLVPYQRPTPADDDWINDEQTFLAAYLARTDLTAWVNSKGRGVYTEFVLTHAHKELSRFARELPYFLDPPRSELIYATGPRDVLPIGLQSLLFETTPAVISSTGPRPPAALGDVGLLMAACVLLALISPRRARNRRLLVVAAAAFFLSLVALALGWILSPIELARLAIPASLLLRLSLWLAVFALLDAFCRARLPVGRRASKLIR